MTESLSVVIPVYNEKDNIAKLLNTLDRSTKNLNCTAYIVYDFKEDNTLPVVNKMKSKCSLKINLVKNMYNGGALNAVKTGFNKAKGEAVLVTMGDMCDNLDDLPKMLNLVSQGFDIVCGSRYMKGGKQISNNAQKRMFSRFIGLSMHYLKGMPTHDLTNNFKMYRRSMLKKIKIESRSGFEIGMEITVKARSMGYKITEVPTTWRERTAGQSRFPLWKWAPAYFRWYVYGLLH